MDEILNEIRGQIDGLNSKYLGSNEELKSLIDSLGTRLDGIEVKMNRPGSPDSTPSDAETKAFVEYARSTSPESKAWSSTNNAGGYALHEDFYEGIIQNLQRISPIRQYATVQQTALNGLQVPVTTGVHTVTGTTETGTRSATNTPTLAQKDIKLYEAYGVAPATYTMLEDAGFDIAGWIKRDISVQLAKWESDKFINGTGSTSSEPEGILTATGISTGSTSATGVIDYVDVVKAYTGIAPEYRANGVWLCSSTVLAELLSIRDSNGAPILVSNMAAGAPMTIFGRPVVEAPHMPDYATTTGTKVLAFCDLSNYWILDKANMVFTSMVDQFSNQPYVNFVGRHRVGGAVVRPEAFYVLSMK